MAITCSLALTTASATARQFTVNGTLTVSNSGGVAVDVQEYHLAVSPHGQNPESVACSQANQGVNPVLGVNSSVPAGGSINYPVAVTLFAPQAATLATTGGGSTSQAYDITCDVTANTGPNIGQQSTTAAQTFTLTAPLT